MYFADSRRVRVTMNDVSFNTSAGKIRNGYAALSVNANVSLGLCLRDFEMARRDNPTILGFASRYGDNNVQMNLIEA